MEEGGNGRLMDFLKSQGEEKPNYKSELLKRYREDLEKKVQKKIEKEFP